MRRKGKKEYKAALDEIEQLWSAPAKSAEADRLDVLTLLVEPYLLREELLAA